MLTLGIFCITDPNNKIKHYNQPITIGLLLFVIGIGFGYNAGYAINPARDLGPRYN